MTAESWILVTGGTGGIGSAVCERLTQQNIRPVIGYCSREKSAIDLARRLEGLPMHINLGDPSTLFAAAANLKNFNLAGVVLNASAPLELCRWVDATPEMLARQWTTAVIGNHILLSNLITQCFRPRRCGRVMGVLSEAGGRGATMPQMMPYTVAKAGLGALLDALAAETKWLTINTVAPGFTDTPMLEAFDPRMIELFREQGKIASPDEVAARIVKGLLA